MKNFGFILIYAILTFPATTVLAQKKVYLSDNVIKTADQIKFEYKNTVKKASQKDAAAIVKLVDFSRLLDGQEAVEHAQTFLEIIPLASDRVVAKAIEKMNVKLKKVTLERLQKAQSKTQNSALKKPLNSWAPFTWEALNNRPVVFPEQIKQPTEKEIQQKMSGKDAVDQSPQLAKPSAIDAAPVRQQKPESNKKQ